MLNPKFLTCLHGSKVLFMAALCNRAGHYIYCPVVSSIFLPIGSRPSDRYFRSVCLSVYLFVCLFVQRFSQPPLIRFRSNLDRCYASGSSCIR